MHPGEDYSIPSLDINAGVD